MSPFPRGKGLGVRFLRPEESTLADSEPTPLLESRDSGAPPDWLNYIAEPRHAWPILLIFGVAPRLLTAKIEPAAKEIVAMANGKSPIADAPKRAAVK